MVKQPLHSFSFKSNARGSAIVGSLVMVAILALVVGIMLSSSNSAIRQSHERIMYEEAYQAAVSGTHVARAFMINPELASKWSGNGSLATSLNDLVIKAKNMNEEIIAQKKNMADTDPSLFSTQRFSSAGIPKLETLADGREVVLEFPDNKPIASFLNRDGAKKFSYNMFTEAPEVGHHSYVDQIRITTPGYAAGSETSSSLRETTFIIESRGVTEYGGLKKERVVLQRVLIYPNEPGNPLISAGEAILTKGTFGIQNKAKSHANVHWAPVLAKGNIELEFINPIQNPAAPGGDWTLSGTHSGKSNIAGMLTNDQAQQFGDGKKEVMDKWLRWMAGSQGQLINGTDSLFKNISGVPVVDFFQQLKAGDFSELGLTMDTLALAGTAFDGTGTTMQNPNGIYVENADGTANGALVQGSSEVDKRVDDFFGSLNYQELKDYAIKHGGYYTYDGSTLRDASGKKTTLPSMGVSGTFDPLSDGALPDRILFIDTPNDASSDPDDIIPNPPLNGTIPIPNFWKGVMYVNGGISEQGGGRPSILARTPDQFKDFRDNDNKDKTTPYSLPNCMMDGILICNGTADLKGNPVIYGTLAALNGVTVNGTPSVFYNSANGEGRLKDDKNQNAEFRLIAGRLTETAP